MVNNSADAYLDKQEVFKREADYSESRLIGKHFNLRRQNSTSRNSTSTRNLKFASKVLISLMSVLAPKIQGAGVMVGLTSLKVPAGCIGSLGSNMPLLGG